LLADKHGAILGRMDHVHTGGTQALWVLSVVFLSRVLVKTWAAHHVDSERSWVADLSKAALYIVD
jgi:hypothetical protein